MVKDTRFYDLLNVSPTVSPQELKKSYKLAALRYHPDKNGHSESAKQAFQQITEAYGILSDERKRKIYDRYGVSDENEIVAILASQKRAAAAAAPAATAARNMEMTPGDLFAHFFGDGFGAGGEFSFLQGNLGGHCRFNSAAKDKARDGKSRGPDIKHNLKCELKELYSGKVAKLGLTRTRLCHRCSGHGSMTSSVCGECRGQGVYSQTRRHGPLVQTWSSSCRNCSGAGTFVKSNDVCQTCRGTGYIRERKIFEVEIKPGLSNKSEIILPGEADQVISTVYGKQQVIPGDVIIIVQEQCSTGRYRRFRESDLVLTRCVVDLRTSLCGGSIYIDDHPSGRPIKLEVIPGELLNPGSIKCVENLGMPKRDNPSQYGDLYIKFCVNFPERLEPETMNVISSALASDSNIIRQENITEPSSAQTRNPDCYEEHVFSNFNEIPDLRKRRHYNSSVAGNKRHKPGGIYESEDEYSDRSYDEDAYDDGFDVYPDARPKTYRMGEEATTAS
ncbi:Apj1p Ecym_5384 [Eremothecium cymbalariae DBVPG|uniref:J domain-containing protein n=1 Tax=Eremothecium cymbalariae (strain CBS 270.75 / DBVPG 7215 / KCTC 17166 / NRRL Y-17582) TaxID=931890 RepID=I6NDJ7_ERECY|nr:hypothetical protein Ecym_5384 [Eremothecium cymbalariae DBVPG\